MKRIFLVLCFIINVLSIHAEWNFVVEESWGENTCIIGIEGDYPEEIYIPNELYIGENHYNIISIGGAAFENNDKLRKVTVASNISNIGTCSFYNCSNLQTLIFEDSSNEIICHSNSFSKLNVLDSLYVGRNITCEETYSTDFAESFSGVKNLIIGKCVTSLPECTSSAVNFRLIDSDEEIYFPKKATASNVYWGRNIKTNTSSKNGCFKITESLEFGGSVTTIPTYGVSGSIVKLHIPQNITEIKDHGFEASIDTLIIDSIDNHLQLQSATAFYLPLIKYIYLGRQLDYLDNTYGAFRGQSKYSENYCKQLEEVYLCDNIESVSDYCFNEQKKLTKVKLPRSLKRISACAFEDCYNLEVIDFPNDIETIGYYAFANCKLTILDLSNTRVYSIENKAFNDTKCKKVYLPDTINEIVGESFTSNNEIELFRIAALNPPIGDSLFKSSDLSNSTLEVPEESLELYKSSAIWSKFGNIVAIPETSNIKSPITNNYHKKYVSKEGVVIKNNDKEYRVSGIKL